MSRHTDRRARTEDLNRVANALAQHEHRATEPLVDVEDWLSENPHRHRSKVLYVVWDRVDAGILTYARPDLDVRVAAGLVNWARRRINDAAEPADIPHPRPDKPETS